MAIKLTLRLDARLIKRAKIYAKRHNTSVSQLVENYFLLLSRDAQKKETFVSSLPITATLRGIIKTTTISEKEYKDYLSKKYL